MALKPRHTFSAVVKDLRRGLADGSITLGRPAFLDTSVLLNVIFQPHPEDQDEVARSQRARDAFDYYRDTVGITTSSTVLFEVIEASARIVFESARFGLAEQQGIRDFLKSVMADLAGTKGIQPDVLEWNSLDRASIALVIRRLLPFLQTTLIQVARLATAAYDTRTLMQNFVDTIAQPNIALRDAFVLSEAAAAGSQYFVTEDPQFDRPEYRTAARVHGAMEILYLGGEITHEPAP